MSESVSRRVIVHGRVQGVFFRDTVRRRAAALGLAGWVRNRADGAVEAVFEGAPDAVEAAIDFCRQGPARAEVSSVEVAAGEPAGLSGFVIR